MSKRNGPDDGQRPGSNNGYREQQERRLERQGWDRNAENVRYQHGNAGNWDRTGNGYESNGGGYGNSSRSGGDRYSVEEAHGMSDRDARDQEEGRYENRYRADDRAHAGGYGHMQDHNRDGENEEMEDEA